MADRIMAVLAIHCLDNLARCEHGLRNQDCNKYRIGVKSTCKLAGTVQFPSPETAVFRTVS